MAYFPFFMELDGADGLIVGGGTVALRKARKLLPYGPRLTVAAPEIAPGFDGLEGVEQMERAFSPELLEGRCFVIAATDNRALNREIAGLCKEIGIPVNAVDDKEACTFLFPSLVKRGRLSIGISTGGGSPSAAVFVKQQVTAALPEHLGDILDWLEGRREAVKLALAEDSPARAACFSRPFTACLEAGGPLDEASFQAVLDGSRGPGRVYLVGAGCGDADLITVRGLRLLRRCDAVVYDDLIAPELLEEAPERAEKVFMGKRQGRHSASQEEICETLIRLARAGKTVVRLKGGDPYLFGRGGEEALALQAAGILWEEVPGIPSAIAIPAQAGIPVTHRGLSRGLHVITAHTAGSPDGLPEDFDRLAVLSGTLVFLMGLSRLPKIARRLMAAGMDEHTPAAVVSGGNAPHPAAVRGTLSDIAEKAKEMRPPAVIVVGPAAAMDLTAGP